MAQKVRFELNIDEIIECKQFPSNDNVVFFGDQATGKTFLFVDKLTGDKQAVVCIEPASESRKYATTNTFFIPTGAVIIDENEKDTKHEALMSHIQDCCDVIRKGMVDMQNEINVYVGQEFDALKAEGINGGNSISEKTLLDALKIVSK